jgi:hypothetical protein
MFSAFKPLFFLMFKVFSIVAVIVLFIVVFCIIIGFFVFRYRRWKRAKQRGVILPPPGWAVFYADCEACKHTSYRVQLENERCDECRVSLPFKKILK